MCHRGEKKKKPTHLNTSSPSCKFLCVNLHISKRSYLPAGLEFTLSWPTGRNVAIWASLTLMALSQKWCQTPRGTIWAQTGSELYHCAVILSVHRSQAKSGKVGCWGVVGEQMLFWIRRDQQRLGKVLLAVAREVGCTTPRNHVRCSWPLRRDTARLNYSVPANGFNNVSKLALQKGRAFLSHFLEGLCEEVLLDHLGWIDCPLLATAFHTVIPALSSATRIRLKHAFQKGLVFEDIKGNRSQRFV